MRRLLVLVLATLPAIARADEATDWEARVRQHYRHYPRIEVMSSSYRGFHICEASKIDKRLRREPWELLLRLSGPDDGAFYAHFRLAITKLAPGVDAMALYREAQKLGFEKGCGASYANEAVIQAGDYLIRLDATCTERHGLFVREVADLVELLRAAGHTVPEQIVFDRCGNPEITFLSVAEILADAHRPGKVTTARARRQASAK
jgi:hypothetical protein